MSQPPQKPETPQKSTGHAPEGPSAAGANTESAPSTSGSAAQFVEQIRKDAQQEIDKIRAKADLSGRRKSEAAEREAESTARQIRQAAKEQAKSIQTRTMAGVSLETKRTMLRAQGEIMDQVFTKTIARLKELRGTKTYAAFLKGLAAQGILALAEETCVLAPAADDCDLFTDRLVADIEKLAGKRSGRKVKVTVSKDLSPAGSGVRVYSSEGNVLFDNTLDARLERLRDELRMIVTKEVFGRQPQQRSVPDSERSSASG